MFKPITRRLSIVVVAASLALVAGFAQAEQTAGDDPKPTPYPLNFCVVSGAELGTMGDPVVIVHEGQEVKFCCAHCTPKFKKNPDEYLKKIADAQKPATTQPADAAKADDDHATHH